MAQNLEFIPAAKQAGAADRFLKCKMWREGLDAELHVQILDVLLTHFYIYDPLQLSSQKVMVPIYLYQVGTVEMAKCLLLSPALSNIPGKYSMQSPTEPPFDLTSLLEVLASDFCWMYYHIILKDGWILNSFGDAFFSRK